MTGCASAWHNVDRQAGVCHFQGEEGGTEGKYPIPL